MAREMTPQERAAAVIETWKTYDPTGFRIGHLTQLIEDAIKATRQVALLDAAQQLCMHCGRRAIGLQVGVTGPNAAGNYVHNSPRTHGCRKVRFVQLHLSGR